MACIDTVVDRRYEELQCIFEQISNNKAIVIAALGLERLWTAFVDSIDIEEYPGLVELQDACMKMMWNRVVRGKISPSEYNDYMKIEEKMDKIMDPDDYGDCVPANASYLVKAFPDAAYWFFNSSGKRRANIAINALQMIASDIYDALDDALLGPESDKQYVALLETHPAILDEIVRIDSDVNLANRYPDNLDDILAMKEYYHNLRIVPVS